MDFGRLETGEGVLDLHVHRSRWVAESAQLSAFGKDFTSREDVDTEGDQDAAPGILLVGERYWPKGEGCLPRWSIAESDSESDPFDVDPTPKCSWAVQFAFGWSLDEKVDQGNYERPSITLIGETRGQRKFSREEVN